MTKKEYNNLLGEYTVSISNGLYNCDQYVDMIIDEDIISIDMSLEEALDIIRDIADEIANEYIEVSFFKNDD